MASRSERKKRPVTLVPLDDESATSRKKTKKAKGSASMDRIDEGDTDQDEIDGRAKTPRDADDDEMETMDPIPPKAKGKGKGKAAAVAEEEQEDEDKITFDEDAADEQEKVTRAAIFSINIIDLREPPLPLKHGDWNDRPINAKAMKRLKDSFIKYGVNAFDVDNALPLILPREHLHPEAINNTLGDPEQAPFLRLTEEGMKAGVLRLAGGHHRYKLVLQEFEAKKKTLTALESKLEKKAKILQSKTAKGTKGPLDELHEDIDELEKKIQGIKRSTLWAVKVFDANIVLQNDELGAHFLSRNMEVVKNVEDDSQKTLRLFKEYTTLAVRSGGSGVVKKWVEKVGKGDQFALQVFQCADDVRFFNILNMFGDTYHHSSTFSIKFVRQNLHGLSGGIIVEILERLANITRGLFSRVPNFEMDEEAMSRHIKFVTSLREDPAGQSKASIDKARNLTIRVWKSIVQARPELSEMADLYLRRLQGRSEGSSVMDLVDDIFKGLDFGKKDCFLTDTESWNNAMDAYFDQVHTVIVEEVVQGVVEMAGSRVVAESIGTHLNWIRFDHSALYHHGRLPLLSPSVLATIIQVFKGIGEGVCEMLSWLYPYIRYFALRPSPELPKDASSAFFYMVRENLDDEWASPTKFIDEIIYMILRNVKHLQALSVQLDSEEIPTRPVKFGAKFNSDAWGVKSANITLFVDEMKKNKTTPSKMTCWVLRKAIKGVATSQNADRDFTPIVQAAKVEERIVSQYRHDVLDDCDSAMWLREQIAEIALKAQKTKKNTYKFVDGISALDALKHEPTVDLSTIVETTRLEHVYRDEKKQVASLLSRIRDSGVSQATPWTKRATQEMVNTVDELEKMLMKNVQRRDLMRRHGKARLPMMASLPLYIREGKLQSSGFEPADVYVDPKSPPMIQDDDDEPDVDEPRWRQDFEAQFRESMESPEKSKPETGVSGALQGSLITDKGRESSGETSLVTGPPETRDALISTQKASSQSGRESIPPEARDSSITRQTGRASVPPEARTSEASTEKGRASVQPEARTFQASTEKGRTSVPPKARASQPSTQKAPASTQHDPHPRFISPVWPDDIPSPNTYRAPAPTRRRDDSDEICSMDLSEDEILPYPGASPPPPDDFDNISEDSFEHVPNTPSQNVKVYTGKRAAPHDGRSPDNRASTRPRPPSSSAAPPVPGPSNAKKVLRPRQHGA